MTVRRLDLDDAEFVAHHLAKLLGHNEPMPAFQARYPGKLESCLNEPFQTFDGKSLYRSLTKKAAVLFYLVIKNHPFSNGNKRMAVTLTMTFFNLNDREVQVGNLALYDLACAVAATRSSDRDEMVGIVDRFFKNHLIDISKLRDF
jgi:death on curing protein